MVEQLLRDGKISIVVFNEYAIGYIRNTQPKYFYVLNSSVIKGYHGDNFQHLIDRKDNVRLANIEDFDTFRLSLDGYLKDPLYHFEKSLTYEFYKTHLRT
jgi:hypothetical protein